MKYYKTSESKVIAIGEEGEIDGDQSSLVQSDWRLMTDKEVEAHINPPKTSEQLEVERKAEIERQLAVLTVTSSKGNVFDANIQARQNMADAILASDTLGITQTVWRMADNSDVQIDIAELKEAHALAIQEYAKIKGIGEGNY